LLIGFLRFIGELIDFFVVIIRNLNFRELKISSFGFGVYVNVVVEVFTDEVINFFALARGGPAGRWR
jgi:hypothetical protein